jgi:hypothetical protein
MITIRGGCHCGAVRFTAELPEAITAIDCNCSICARTGYLHVMVPHHLFRLDRGRGSLTSYRFGTGAADHLFCSICGVKSFYQPRSHPDCWSVNLRALDDPATLEVRKVPFDGRDWERAHRTLD